MLLAYLKESLTYIEAINRFGLRHRRLFVLHHTLQIDKTETIQVYKKIIVCEITLLLALTGALYIYALSVGACPVTKPMDM